MRAIADVFRRQGVIVVQTMSKALDFEWHLNTELVAFPADVSDRTLGEAVLHGLAEAGAHQPATLTSGEESAKYRAERNAALGATDDRDLARGCDAVSFVRNGDALSITPLVVFADGGYGAWGGREPVPQPVDAESLGRLCREAFDRDGVRPPDEGIPSHS